MSDVVAAEAKRVLGDMVYDCGAGDGSLWVILHSPADEPAVAGLLEWVFGALLPPVRFY